MNTQQKNRVVTVLLAAVFFGLSVWSWLKPADIYSDTERRHLAQFPELSIPNILAENSFMGKFEAYATDQFPMREPFRTLNAAVNKYVFGQKLVNDIYIENGYAAKLEYPLNEDSLDWALSRFRSIQERYLENSTAYIAVVPDKGYFLAEENGYLVMDYEALFEIIRVETQDYAAYIDLSQQLSLNHYYRTDTHWKQEMLTGVADTLAQAMNVRLQDTAYAVQTADVAFSGVYAGQAALPLASDTLCYMTSSTLSALKVLCWDTGKPVEMPLYDLDKAAGKDGYELFLSGSRALITMENPKAKEKRELVIFRDSFCSSLAPLLASGYSKVTVADTRYLSPAFLGQFIDFDGADVLFLYSTSVLNNSQGQLLP
jgi:hypothetical protein